MKYEIVWAPLAEETLAKIWMASQNKQSVNKAASRIENYLKILPLNVGVPRESSVQRLIGIPPLVAFYEVIEDDKSVIVQYLIRSLKG